MALRTIRRWIPLVLLVALSALAWNAAEAADIDDASDEPIGYDHELDTPVLSARRIPQTLQAPLANDALAPHVDTLLIESTVNTCLVVGLDGRVLFQANEGLALVPASNQKLVTTYAAIQTLGASTTFTTSVVASTAVNAGVLEGNLYFVGGGDPFLATDDWWEQYSDNNGRTHTRLEELADRVAATGLTEVTGSLVGDESMLDTERVGDWAQRLIDTNQSGPLTALAVNQGFSQWPVTYEGSSRPRVPSPDPARTATEVFASLLAERGVTVSAIETGLTPRGLRTIAEIESPPLIDIVTHVNSYSDNFGAELLLKHIGLVSSGDGSTNGGAAAVTEFLSQKSFPMEGVKVVDGSGLAESETLTCNLLAAVLSDAGFDSPFARSLSIGGERGSLIRRHVETPAQGRLLAKTGTLNGVTALSGFALSAVESDSALVFSYIVNGELAGQDEAIRSLQAPFVEALVQYPMAPSLTVLTPRPAIEVTTTSTTAIDE